MAAAQVVIDQAGKPAGVAGRSRSDLDLLTLVTLSNGDDTGVRVWRWSLTPPPGSAAVLSNTTGPTSSFTPDIEGSYRIELQVNAGLKGERNTVIAAVLDGNSFRFPALKEGEEFNEGGNLFGWGPALDKIIRALSNASALNDWKDSVRLATAAALPANTSSGGPGPGKRLTGSANGALSVDGVLTVINDRVLVKNEVAGLDNGIYSVTQVGDGSNPYILTRALDFDEDAEVTNGATTTAGVGATNAGRIFLLSTSDPITVDVTAQSWTEISSTVPTWAAVLATVGGNTSGGTNVIISAGDSLDVQGDIVSTTGDVTITDSLRLNVANAILTTGTGLGSPVQQMQKVAGGTTELDFLIGTSVSNGAHRFLHDTDETFHQQARISAAWQDISVVGLTGVTTMPLSLGVAGGDPTTADAGADDCVVGDGVGNRGISIIAGDPGIAALKLGDPADKDDGQVAYNNAARTLGFFAASGERMRIAATDVIPIGTMDLGDPAARWNRVIGVTVDGGGATLTVGESGQTTGLVSAAVDFSNANVVATFGNGLGTPLIVLDKLDAGTALVRLRNVSVTRWEFGMAADEDWILSRFNASGVFQDSPILIDEALGNILTLAILPQADSTHTIGSAGLRWSTAFADALDALDTVIVGNAVGSPNIFLNKAAAGASTVTHRTVVGTDTIGDKRTIFDAAEDYLFQHFNGSSWRSAIQIVNDAIVNMLNASPTWSWGDASGNPILQLFKHTTQEGKIRFRTSMGGLILGDKEIGHDANEALCLQHHNGSVFIPGLVLTDDETISFPSPEVTVSLGADIGGKPVLEMRKAGAFVGVIQWRSIGNLAWEQRHTESEAWELRRHNSGTEALVDIPIIIPEGTAGGAIQLIDVNPQGSNTLGKAGTRWATVFAVDFSVSGQVRTENSSAGAPDTLDLVGGDFTGGGAGSEPGADVTLAPGTTNSASGVEGLVDVKNSGTVQLIERAAVIPGIAGGRMRLWARSDSPNTLMVTDDAGGDHPLSIWEQTWTADDAVLDGSTPPARTQLTEDYVVLEYDGTNPEIAFFRGILPFSYAAGGITVEITYAGAAANGASDDVVYEGAWERTTAAASLVTSSFDTGQKVTTTPAAVANLVVKATIVFTTGQIDLLQPGEMFRLRLTRLPGDAADTFVNDTRVVRVRAFETH